MKYMHIWKSLAIIVILSLKMTPVISFASIIGFNFNLNDKQIDSATSHTSYINMGRLLNSSGLNYESLNIDSAKLIFSYKDDNDDPWSGKVISLGKYVGMSSITTDYRYSPFDDSYYRERSNYYEKDVYYSYVSENEVSSAKITIPTGSSVVTGSSGNENTKQTTQPWANDRYTTYFGGADGDGYVRTGTYHEQSCTRFGCITWDFDPQYTETFNYFRYDVNYKTWIDMTADWQSTLELDAAALLFLERGSSIYYNVESLAGDFLLSSVRLELDWNPIKYAPIADPDPMVQPEATSSIPEPSALALMCLGLLGFAANRRKTQK